MTASVPEWLPDAPWLPVTAPLTAGTTRRDARTTEAVVAQFAVGTHPRYQPHRDGEGVSTWCNIFLSDVTRALGCEVPRWWQSGGELVELSANAQCDWLARKGPSHGWDFLGADVAAANARADLGQVVVATWRNPVGARSGHVALVLPTRGEPGLHVAQAGLRCSSRLPLAEGFGTRLVTFFAHL